MADQLNRAQRRAASRKPSTPVVEPGMYRQLQPPEVMGEITAREANEIKALNKLVDRAADDAQHAQRMHAVAQAHLTTYVRTLVTGRGFDIATGQYNVDPDSGQILKTHEMTPVVPIAPLEVVEPNGKE